ncbi:MAG: hypothetical protein LC749_00710 [Actinobacteria bacterium]|nr:hypothetical protein [Actinomycetota bacterium]
MSTHEQDGVTRRARAQQVALFRYQLICPALEPGLSTKARGRVVRAIAAGVHQGPLYVPRPVMLSGASARWDCPVGRAMLGGRRST